MNAINIKKLHVDWACMVGEDFRLKDKGFRSYALGFARNMLAPFKDNIIKIIDYLISNNYRFMYAERAHSEPDGETIEWIEEYERKGIYLPISLQAWLLEVGCFNLIGTNNDWPKTSYLSDGNVNSNDVWLTDPLVVEVTNDYIEYLYNEWKYGVEEEGLENVGPFKIDFSPDYLHKANISGGMPYEIIADTPAVDSIVLNERTCTSFTGYIRNALLWGGFPGIAHFNDSDRKYLREIIDNGISL